MSYRRRKTGRALTVSLTPEAMQMVRMVADRNPDSPYLFPILQSEEGTEAAYREYQSALRAFNQRLAVLRQCLGMQSALSTYAARHTWATMAYLAELRKPKQERQPRKAETTSSKQTLSEISKTIQRHQRQLTEEEKTFLQASIDNRYQERAVANGSLMMCEVQGAKEDFIRRWNTIFKEYPDVFEDSDCRKIIHDLTEDAVQYLLKIKEKTL